MSLIDIVSSDIQGELMKQPVGYYQDPASPQSYSPVDEY